MLFWVRVLVASLCFRDMPLFLAIIASTVCTSLLVHSIHSEAVPLHADSLDISSQGKGSAVRQEGHHGSHQETGLCPGSAPAGGHTGQVPSLRGFPFLTH